MKTELQKAALMLSSLPCPLASQLLDQIPAKQVAVIRRMADESKRPSREDRKLAINEFLRLTKRQKKTKSAPRTRIDPPATQMPPIHFLTPRPASEIIGLLGEELPQTQAAILSHLPASLAAEVLALLPKKRRLQIVRRLSGGGTISPLVRAEMAEVISQLLCRRLPVGPGMTRSSSEFLDQLLANSTGAIHQILAESIQQSGAARGSAGASQLSKPD
ncbi:MAG: hypothetical protein P8N76_28025 [Pirellulaceae bacterium]|nr:hypothetical protein [Pirellulaceae bacterium]